jgi:hypothetical protein
MSKASSAFFGGTAIVSSPVVPRFSHDGKSTAGYSYTPVARSETGGILTGDSQPLPFGTEVIVDFGNFIWGSGCFRPYDMSLLVPYGQPIPGVVPGRIGEYKDLLGLFLYVKGRGLCQWLIGGVLAQNSVYNLWLAFGRAAESVQGLLPVLTLRPSLAIPIASRNGELSWQPILKITGWVNRDTTVFGSRTVAPPQTRLANDNATAATPGVKPQPTALPQPVPVILPPEQLAPAMPAVPITLQHPPQPAAAYAAPPPPPRRSMAAPVIPPPAGEHLFATMVPATAPAAPVASATTAPPQPANAAAAAPESAPAPTTTTTAPTAGSITVAAPSAVPRF